MRSKFLQDIYLVYFVIFRASRLQFGTGTTQPSQSYMALVIFARNTWHWLNLQGMLASAQKMPAFRI